MAMFESVDPADTIKARKTALEDFTNLKPMQANTQKYQRDALKMQAMDATGRMPQKTQEGAVESTGALGLGTLGMLQKAGSMGAQMLPKQGEETDKLNLQGAMLQQDMADSKTKQAAENTVRGMENETQRLARLVADRAFESGFEAKQLIFSQNNALADYAFEAAQKDYQSGRLSDKEIRDLTNTFKLEAETKKQKADAMLREWQGKFEADMAAGNTERLKSRLTALLEAQKEALESAAKAQATAIIISGITETVGTAWGGIVGDVIKGGGKIFGGII